MLGHPAYLAVFVVLLVAAAATDIAARKIPNWISSSVALTGLVWQCVAAGAQNALLATVGAVVVAFILIPFWRLRLLGGGDLKLAVGAAVGVGLPRTPAFLVVSLLAGGIVGVACYAMSGHFARATIRANLTAMHAPTLHEARASPGTVLVPYGVAFAAGAIWIVLS